MAETGKLIYSKIKDISKAAGALEKTTSQGVPFAFRGVDAVINHLSPLLNEHEVIVVPTVHVSRTTPREVGTRVVKTTEVITEFTFFATDGSAVSATTVGLADDFGDRSAAQAQSVAFRIALLQTFHLPTDEKEEERSQEVANQVAELSEKVAKTAKPVAPVATASIDAIRASIAEVIAGTYADPTTGEVKPAYEGGGAAVNKLGNELTKKTPKQWGANVDDLKAILKAITK